MSSLLEELKWRGLIAQTTDEKALSEALDAGVTMYCGFDPTAPSLHHGNLVQLIMLKHLQRAGHKVIALVGGATGLIGDPRMSGERVLNTPDVVQQWVDRLRGQISQFLAFEGDNPAQMVNNLDWTQGLSALDFLRDVGKHFRLSTMLAKDTVARRLESDEGISFTEFSYQILQGMDYLELYRRHGCTLQTGGNDQWGNLVSGVDLIRRVERQTVHALTTPIITKSDGTKFGKSEGGAIWLDPQMLSPYDFYQFWLNADDADVIPWLRTFTFLDRDEIERLEHELQENPGARVAQRALAREVTTLVHGQQAVAQAEAAAQALFGSGSLAELELTTLRAAVTQLPQAQMGEDGVTIVDALIASGLVKSVKLAIQAVKSGGVYLNNEKVADTNARVQPSDLLHGQYAILRRGKRTLAVISRENTVSEKV